MVEKKGNHAFTWCPICENQVSEKYKDTEKLLNHIRTFHPPVPDEERTDVKQKGRFQVFNKLKSVKKASKSSIKINQKKRKKIEKNLEKEKILCPVCNVEAAPLVFGKSSRKLTDCRLGAICLLGCWPLCFVPLMISRDKSVRMVCPLCGYDYGTYDVRKSTNDRVIVKTTRTFIRKPEIRGKTSSTIIFRPKEENTDKENNSKDREELILEENFNLQLPEIQQGESNDSEEEYDLTGERRMHEKKIVNLEICPVESFNYASVKRVERETSPVEIEKCGFCLGEMEGNKREYCLSHRSQRHRSLVHRPVSKNVNRAEYSNACPRLTKGEIPSISTNCQRSYRVSRKC